MQGAWARHRGDIAVGACLAVSTATVVTGLVASASLTHNDNVYAPTQFALGFPCVMVGAFLAHRQPRHPVGWVLMLAGWGAWASAATSTIIGRLQAPTWYARPLLLVGVSSWLLCRALLQVGVPALYPAGFPASRWRRLAVGLAGTAILATCVLQSLTFATFDFATGEPASWSPPFARWLPRGIRLLFALAILANVDLVVRVARMRGADSRRHRTVAGVAVALAVPGVLSLAAAAGYGSGLNSDLVEFLANAALPLGIAYGVVRHRALGFDVIIRRTALYGGITVVAAALYVGVVAAFSAVLQHGAGAGPIVATGLVAVSLMPARTVVQRGLDRWVFGDRDEPYRALADLGRRLECSTAADDSLTIVADAVRAALRIPSVYIELQVDADGGPVRLASSGVPGMANDPVERFELTHDGQPIGAIIAGLPPGETAFGASERRLLADLARAAGVVAHSVQLSIALSRSRGRLVRAREEERRRLRHDLHDGLGPTLASVALGLDAAAGRLESDPALSGLLRDLDHELQEAITDIRRLVYGLRPPALDDLGLVPALRQHAHELTARSGSDALTIAVESDAELPHLGAAVEVAAFRIALEGMTNVLRHADASHCVVRLRAGQALEVSVEDDGRGIDLAQSAGVGLESMRDRAEELGGRLLVAAGERGGTIVRAVLPLTDRRSA